MKRFRSRDDRVVVLEQLNPDAEIRIPSEEVTDIHRVVGSVEHA